MILNHNPVHAGIAKLIVLLAIESMNHNFILLVKKIMLVINGTIEHEISSYEWISMLRA